MGGSDRAQPSLLNLFAQAGASKVLEPHGPRSESASLRAIQGSQRGLEYDTLSDRYSNWVEQELLPAVAQKYGVSFTTDPEEGRSSMYCTQMAHVLDIPIFVEMRVQQAELEKSFF